MNEFSLVNRADAEVQRDIDGWLDKIREYLRVRFLNDIKRTLGTEFGDCISKVIYLAERAIVEPDTFRGVRDVQGRLQAGAIVAPNLNYLDVDVFTNAPWNVLKNQPETIKGAATSLMEELVNESFELGMMGRIKLTAIKRAKLFYTKIGLTEEEDNILSLELTPTAARIFLSRPRSLRRNSSLS